MKNYLKLVNFELGRSMKMYLALMGIVIISQIIGTFRVVGTYMDHFNESIYETGMSIEQFLDQFGSMSLMYLQYSPWFNLPVVFSAAVLILYCFFIWYRDWFGKNTFVYRLLMLPTARINIYLSKATTILLMVLGLVALQVILLQVESSLLKMLVPDNLRTDLSILDLTSNTIGSMYLGILIPSSFTQFIVHYGIGLMSVLVLFTAILFERSFRFIGLIYGFLYIALSVIVFHFPIILMLILQKSIFYPNEMFYAGIFLWAVVMAMNIVVSHYLINKKISV